MFSNKFGRRFYISLLLIAIILLVPLNGIAFFRLQTILSGMSAFKTTLIDPTRVTEMVNPSQQGDCNPVSEARPALPEVITRLHDGLLTKMKRDACLARTYDKTEKKEVIKDCTCLVDIAEEMASNQEAQALTRKFETTIGETVKSRRDSLEKRLISLAQSQLFFNQPDASSCNIVQKLRQMSSEPCNAELPCSNYKGARDTESNLKTYLDNYATEEIQKQRIDQLVREHQEEQTSREQRIQRGENIKKLAYNDPTKLVFQEMAGILAAIREDLQNEPDGMAKNTKVVGCFAAAIGLISDEQLQPPESGEDKNRVYREFKNKLNGENGPRFSIYKAMSGYDKILEDCSKSGGGLDTTTCETRARRHLDIMKGKLRNMSPLYRTLIQFFQNNPLHINTLYQVVNSFMTSKGQGGNIAALRNDQVATLGKKAEKVLKNALKNQCSEVDQYISYICHNCNEPKKVDFQDLLKASKKFSKGCALSREHTVTECIVLNHISRMHTCRSIRKLFMEHFLPTLTQQTWGTATTIAAYLPALGIIPGLGVGAYTSVQQFISSEKVNGLDNPFYGIEIADAFAFINRKWEGREQEEGISLNNLSTTPKAKGQETTASSIGQVLGDTSVDNRDTGEASSNYVASIADTIKGGTINSQTIVADRGRMLGSGGGTGGGGSTGGAQSKDEPGTDGQTSAQITGPSAVDVATGSKEDKWWFDEWMDQQGPGERDEMGYDSFQRKMEQLVGEMRQVNNLPEDSKERNDAGVQEAYDNAVDKLGQVENQAREVRRTHNVVQERRDGGADQTEISSAEQQYNAAKNELTALQAQLAEARQQLADARAAVQGTVSGQPAPGTGTASDVPAAQLGGQDQAASEKPDQGSGEEQPGSGGGGGDMVGGGERRPAPDDSPAGGGGGSERPSGQGREEGAQGIVLISSAEDFPLVQDKDGALEFIRNNMGTDNFTVTVMGEDGKPKELDCASIPPGEECEKVECVLKDSEGEGEPVKIDINKAVILGEESAPDEVATDQRGSTESSEVSSTPAYDPATASKLHDWLDQFKNFKIW